jgi:hypothetical protein
MWCHELNYCKSWHLEIPRYKLGVCFRIRLLSRDCMARACGNCWRLVSVTTYMSLWGQLSETRARFARAGFFHLKEIKLGNTDNTSWSIGPISLRAFRPCHAGGLQRATAERSLSSVSSSSGARQRCTGSGERGQDVDVDRWPLSSAWKAPAHVRTLDLLRRSRELQQVAAL